MSANSHRDEVKVTITIVAPGAPLTYFNDGGGGPSDFLGLKF